jgi:hypothetical protein
LELSRPEGSSVSAYDGQPPLPHEHHVRDERHDLVEPRVLHHYVIVRADIPVGLRAAQIIHAAGESALLADEIPPGTHAVALTADSEAALAEVGRALDSENIPHTKVFEDTAPFHGQLMGIGVAPLPRTSNLKRVLGRLPTLK